MSLQDDAEREFRDMNTPGLDPNMHWVEGHEAMGRRGRVWVPGHWSRDPSGEARAELRREGAPDTEMDPWQITEQRERLSNARRRLAEEHVL